VLSSIDFLTALKEAEALAVVPEVPAPEPSADAP
jgi:hypothetical protein